MKPTTNKLYPRRYSVMHIASEQSFTIRNDYLYEKGARNFF